MTRIDTKNRPVNWRTQRTHDLYMAHIDSGAIDHDCPLCVADSIHEFEFWKIVKNNYPYDAVAQVHDIIIPIRHTAGSDLTEKELAELTELKETVLNDRYNFIVEALPKAKSIPGHFHFHLIVPKQPH